MTASSTHSHLAATDLADCAAHELLQLYRTGQASPVDATRAVVDHVLIPILGRRLVEASIENEAPKSNQKSL